MKLIIDIPEEIVKEMKTEDLISIEVIDNAIECIKNGTPFDSVIEDIKAEIHENAEMNEDGKWYLYEKWIIEILNKHIGKENKL